MTKTPVNVLSDLALDSRNVNIKNETFMELFPDLVAKIMQDLLEDRQKSSLTDDEKLMVETINTKSYNEKMKGGNGKNNVRENHFWRNLKLSKLAPSILPKILNHQKIFENYILKFLWKMLTKIMLCVWLEIQSNLGLE